jgi:tetratricopeptide (TPR) repeat protein
MASYGTVPDPVAYLAKAEVMLKQQIEHRPSVPGAHFYLGAIYRMRGQWEDALKALEDELAINPSHAPSYAALGHTLTRLGRPQEALEQIHYAMRLSPKDNLAAYWLAYEGAAELELGRTEKAIEHLTNSYSQNSHYPVTLLTLAAAHALAGNAAEGTRYLDELAKLSPQFSRAKLIERYSGTRVHPSNFKRGMLLVLAVSGT